MNNVVNLIDPTKAAPQVIQQLITSYPGARIINFLDGSVGIEINNRTWASQRHQRQYFKSDDEYQSAKIFPPSVWSYIHNLEFPILTAA